MGWWDLQDAALVVQMNTFGEPVVWYPPAGPPEGIVGRAIFDEPPRHTDLGLVMGLTDQIPWCGVRVLELPDGYTPRQGERVGIRGADWEIADLSPDGGGHVRMRLLRVGAGSTGPLPPLTSPDDGTVAVAGRQRTRWPPPVTATPRPLLRPDE